MEEEPCVKFQQSLGLGGQLRRSSGRGGQYWDEERKNDVIDVQ